jgi:hypothetical protein
MPPKKQAGTASASLEESKGKFMFLQGFKRKNCSAKPVN